jgi:hypothetical protein
MDEAPGTKTSGASIFLLENGTGFERISPPEVKRREPTHDLMLIPASSNLSIRSICAFIVGARFTVRVGRFEVRYEPHECFKTNPIRGL